MIDMSRGNNYMDTHITISDTKQDEGSIAAGIKVKGRKIRISGAVIRIEAIPRNVGINPDFKLSIWLPNFKLLEADDTHGYVGWGDLLSALSEAASGEKPKNINTQKTIEVGGIPIKVYEMDEEEEETIEESEDPLKEIILPPVKKEETTTVTKTSTSTSIEVVNEDDVDVANINVEHLDINALVAKNKAEIREMERKQKEYNQSNANARVGIN
jgi:hypothetical protein